MVVLLLGYYGATKFGTSEAIPAAVHFIEIPAGKAWLCAHGNAATIISTAARAAADNMQFEDGSAERRRCCCISRAASAAGLIAAVLGSAATLVSLNSFILCSAQSMCWKMKSAVVAGSSRQM